MEIYVLESVTWPCGNFNSHSLAYATSRKTLEELHESESAALNKFKGVVRSIPSDLLDDDDVIASYCDHEHSYCVIRTIEVMD
jgi:hypothetical protein